MKVFKFGGGILHSADEIRKLPGILRRFPDEDLLVVVSAFGKTTNALENLAAAAFNETGQAEPTLREITEYHEDIISRLFGDESQAVKDELKSITKRLNNALSGPRPADFNEFYDQVIGFGELMSSTIIRHFLNHGQIDALLFDVRKVIRTDSTFRDASVDWEKSREQLENVVRPGFHNHRIMLTQGFLGCDAHGKTTSLGREGSDYTASIFANLLDAEEVIIWKDVPGILNADPKHFRQTVKLDEISYAEATELAYYGAKVIHPKTVKPLQNKQIPLQVRSYLNPDEPGTLIHANAASDQFIPSFIFKFDQVLVSVSEKDLSFVNEQMFSDVFSLLSRYSIHLNILQNSALTLTFCLDNHPKIKVLIESLQGAYVVRYNENLELVTIRHYNERAREHALQGKEVLLEQQNRAVVQYVVR